MILMVVATKAIMFNAHLCLSNEHIICKLDKGKTLL